MYKKLLSLQILFLAAATAGCSLAPYQQKPVETAIPTEAAAPAGTPAPEEAPASGAHQPQPVDTGAVMKKIYRQHREWKGTRYALGGMSKRGIDCSALVQATYLDHFGIELPRTTWQQARIGEQIDRSELRAGDLVFFRTGRRTRHVGIYLEDNKFFHASTRRGVTISRLSDHYWRGKYWHARRIDFDAPHTPQEK